MRLSLDPRYGYAYVPVLIGREGSFQQILLLLDTGAARTTISGRIATDLGLPLLTEGRGANVHGVSGIDACILFPIDLTVLGRTVLRHEVQFTSFPRFPVDPGAGAPLCEGLLGNDLLRAADLRAVVDVPSGRAVLANHRLR